MTKPKTPITKITQGVDRPKSFALPNVFSTVDPGIY